MLDIFGFELYEDHELRPKDSKIVNGLDQLNINICNELLQQHFVSVSRYRWMVCWLTCFVGGVWV